MSFFEHLGGERPGYEPPSRVYAWVDSAADQADNGYTRLDCLDADWVDEAEPERIQLSNPELSDEAEQRVSMALWRQETSCEQEGRIAEVRLRDADLGDEPDFLHYANLTGPPVERMVEEVRWPDPHEQMRLANMTEIGAGEASDEAVAEALSSVPDAFDAVAIYDVGQGSCSALIAEDRPRLYFDMGCGGLGDAGTVPTGLTGICTTAFPPVVLSHWHFDHWGLVKRFGGEILRSTWIVPRQSNMRPGAAALLGLVRQHGVALVRTPQETSLRVGAISIHDCTGRGMNDSGLALVAWGGRERPILLPGDARYRYIADLPEAAQSLVAAHHGGHTRAAAAEVPVPLGGCAARLAFSCGPGNSYGHPLPGPREAHELAGWGLGTHLSTGDRRQGSEPEHLHLYWDASDHTVGVGCRGTHCSLSPSHR